MHVSVITFFEFISAVGVVEAPVGGEADDKVSLAVDFTDLSYPMLEIEIPIRLDPSSYYGFVARGDCILIFVSLYTYIHGPFFFFFSLH